MRNTLSKSIGKVTLTILLSTMLLAQTGLSHQYSAKTLEDGDRSGEGKPAGSEVHELPGGQSIEGTWIAKVADPTGAITLFEVGNFSPDGSYTGANVNGLHSTHKGVWARMGHGKFVLTVLFFTHDAQGTFNGIVKARIYLTLAEDQNSYDSVAERIVMDKFGNVLSVTPGIPGHAVRMNVELPQYLPPQ